MSSPLVVVVQSFLADGAVLAVLHLLIWLIHPPPEWKVNIHIQKFLQSKSQIKFSPIKLPDATLAKTVSTTEDDKVMEIRKRLQANGAFLVWSSWLEIYTQWVINEHLQIVSLPWVMVLDASHHPDLGLERKGGGAAQASLSPQSVFHCTLCCLYSIFSSRSNKVEMTSHFPIVISVNIF